MVEFFMHLGWQPIDTIGLGQSLFYLLIPCYYDPLHIPPTPITMHTNLMWLVCGVFFCLFVCTLYNLYFILYKLLHKWYYSLPVNIFTPWFNLKFCPWSCVNISLLILTAIGYFMMYIHPILFLHSCDWNPDCFHTPVITEWAACLLGPVWQFLWELCLEL